MVTDKAKPRRQPGQPAERFPLLRRSQYITKDISKGELMENQAEPVIVDSIQSQTLQRDYACAGCWGHLNSYFTKDGGIRVVCDRCGDGRGFVRKAWVERRRALAELAEDQQSQCTCTPRDEQACPACKAVLAKQEVPY